jgi:hypothetical protein
MGIPDRGGRIPGGWRGRALPLALAAVGSMACVGCQSPFVMVAPEVGEDVPSLGHGKGSAYSHLFFAADIPVYLFIPIGWKSRTGDAYGEAVAGVPGATALAEVKIREIWYWWVHP